MSPNYRRTIGWQHWKCCCKKSISPWPQQSASARLKKLQKKQRSSLLASQQPEIIATLQRPCDKRTAAAPTTFCLECGVATHPTLCIQCTIYGQACLHYQKVGHFLKVYYSKDIRCNPHMAAKRPHPAHLVLNT